VLPSDLYLSYSQGTATGQINFFSGPEMKGELVEPVLKTSEIVVPETPEVVVAAPSPPPKKEEKPAPPPKKEVKPTPAPKKEEKPAPPKEEKPAPPKEEKKVAEAPKVEAKKEVAAPAYPSTTLPDGKKINSNVIIDESVLSFIKLASSGVVFPVIPSNNLTSHDIYNTTSGLKFNNKFDVNSTNMDNILSKASEIIETIEVNVSLENISLGETCPVEFAANVAKDNNESESSDKSIENNKISKPKQTEINFVMDILEEATPFPYTVNVDTSDDA